MIVRTCGEKHRGRCSINENMENGSEWISNDRKTKTGVERCYIKT